MLRTKIIASDVQNLTDARYFAAWGVDYMSFAIQDFAQQAAAIKEMKDWVEGPVFMLEYSGLEPLALVNEQLTAMEMDHMLLGAFASEELLSSEWEIIRTITMDHLENATGRCVLKSDAISEWTAEQKASVKQLCSETSVYLDAIFTGSDIDEILSYGFEGLVLRGGEEEKVGVKTYEDLDDIMEALEID